MTNLEWLIKENPELAIKCISKINTVISINKKTGVISACDNDCYNCIFNDEDDNSIGCVCKIAEWLKAKHKDKKQIKDLTEEEFDKVCDDVHSCSDCPLELNNGYCYKNVMTYIKQEYNTTFEELVEFREKTVEV